MPTITVTLGILDIERKFKSDDNGTNCRPTKLAVAQASKKLGVPGQELLWSCPDVFSVRYGSSYIATATARNGDAVRFLSSIGTFEEGDDE